MLFDFSRRPLLMIMANKVRLAIGIVLVVLIVLSISFLVSLNLPEKSISGLEGFPVNGHISETNIQFQTDQRDPLLKGEEYFVSYRLDREQFRQETKDMLEALIYSSDAKNKAVAQTKWLDLSTKIAQENELEILLKIKGIQDVVVDVNYDSVNVIVLTQGLTPDEIFLIRDTVTRVIKFSDDKIIISVINK